VTAEPPRPPAPDALHQDWEALLRTVVATPDDDLPRLVAADWLDENAGHFAAALPAVSSEESWAARAELIRVQCQLARLTRADADFARLARLERRLLTPFHADRLLWTLEACPQLVRLQVGSGSALAGLVLTSPAECTFRRGFVEAVRCPAADWRAHGPAVCARQPIREVSITHLGDLTQGEAWELREALAAVPTVRLLYTHEPAGVPLTFFRERLSDVADGT
jgi:uncharacterized protein (TIGR02996 family)